MLSVSHISFAYARRHVLEDVSFDVDSGEIVALTGANGVGKTTLLRIIAGLLMPESGTVELDRIDGFEQPLRFRRLFGYMSEECPLHDDMTVKAYLKYRAALKGERVMKVRRRVTEAAAMCGLENLLDVTIRFLSKGQRKRVALADAMLLRPRLLLLDDVFAGVDAETRSALAVALKSIAANSSILITGHEHAEFAKFVTRTIVLENGVVRK